MMILAICLICVPVARELHQINCCGKVLCKIHKLIRKDIENHKKEVSPRRQYECPHCMENGKYQEGTTIHLEECPKMKIPELSK